MLPALADDVTGVIVKRKFIFRERWIRHGRYYPTILLRIWRNGAGEIEQRWMDEHIILKRGRAALLEGGDLVDHNLNGLDAWIAKHNRYATLAMVDYLNRELRLFDEDTRMERDGRRRQAQSLPQEFRLRAAAALSARGADVSSTAMSSASAFSTDASGWCFTSCTASGSSC